MSDLLITLALVLFALLSTPGAAQSLTLLGESSITAGSGSIEFNADGMGRITGAPGTALRMPVAGRVSIRRPTDLVDVHAEDGRIYTWISLGTHVPEGPIAAGAVVGTIGDRGFANLTVRPSDGPDVRPDPAKPWIVLPAPGGLKIIQISKVSVKVSGGGSKRPDAPSPRPAR